MSGYARISASLCLTLVVWLPTAIHAVRGDRVDLANVAIRFLIVFTLAKTAMRGIDRLLRVYAQHNGTMAARGTPPVDVDGVSVMTGGSAEFSRRRFDATDVDSRTSANTTSAPITILP